MSVPCVSLSSLKAILSAQSEYHLSGLKFIYCRHSFDDTGERDLMFLKRIASRTLKSVCPQEVQENVSLSG